jgi:hypothetical protein
MCRLAPADARQGLVQARAGAGTHATAAHGGGQREGREEENDGQCVRAVLGKIGERTVNASASAHLDVQWLCADLRAIQDTSSNQTMRDTTALSVPRCRFPPLPFAPVPLPCALLFCPLSDCGVPIGGLQGKERLRNGQACRHTEPNRRARQAHTAHTHTGDTLAHSLCAPAAAAVFLARLKKGQRKRFLA